MRDCGLTVIERHTTQPDWIEAFLASPSSHLPAAQTAGR
jgi:hypothetical protein